MNAKSASEKTRDSIILTVLVITSIVVIGKFISNHIELNQFKKEQESKLKLSIESSLINQTIEEDEMGCYSLISADGKELEIKRIESNVENIQNDCNLVGLM